jgi:hypothetical protein
MRNKQRHFPQAMASPTSNKQVKKTVSKQVSKPTPLNMLKPAGKLGTYGAW